MQGLALGAEGVPQRLASPLPWLPAQRFKRTRCGIEAVCGSAAFVSRFPCGLLPLSAHWLFAVDQGCVSLSAQCAASTMSTGQ